jgi:hypothetical protein
MKGDNAEYSIAITYYYVLSRLPSMVKYTESTERTHQKRAVHPKHIGPVSVLGLSFCIAQDFVIH